MDPYLEAHGDDVCTRLLTCARDALQAQMPADLTADLQEQSSIRIIESRSENRVVTAVEILCPANKQTEEGRQAYRRKQQELLQSGACLVEIDLLRGGEYVLMVPCEVMPLEPATPYRACITIGGAPRRGSVYRIAFRERLPVIRIPLRENDRDASLDLQAIVDKAYENGGYDLDYRADSVPPLSGDDVAWADKLLREQGLR